MADQEKAIETRLMEILMQDQRTRSGTDIDLQALRAQDTERRSEILRYLQDGSVVSGQALYAAAMVLQHGNCPDHYRFANELAQRAIERGEQQARWLYAATLDRYLLSQGKPQKFGTQYRIDGDRWELLPTDPKTTDKERALYDVPPFSQARSMTAPVPVTTPKK